MTGTPLVYCHDLHVPQHAAVFLLEPLNQIISFAPSRTETVFIAAHSAYHVFHGISA